jgi:hypothetical protein
MRGPPACSRRLTRRTIENGNWCDPTRLLPGSGGARRPGPLLFPVSYRSLRLNPPP